MGAETGAGRRLEAGTMRSVVTRRSVVNVVPPNSDVHESELRSSSDRNTMIGVHELKAEISKHKRLITESEKRFAFLEQNYVSLQLKFQNYKQCSDTSSASNAIFNITSWVKYPQIRNLDAQINIMKVLKFSFSKENVNLKRRYEELSKSNAYSRSTFTAKINGLNC
ncbi:hypothetical protein Tco_0504721 [Tanacetum coccineum]